jgi:hypothetical protein
MPTQADTASMQRVAQVLAELWINHDERKASLTKHSPAFYD